MKTVLPAHPHIYEFIRLLQEEHVFQRHQAEESQIQIRKKKKRNNDVDLLLEQLLQQFYDGQFTQMDLAVKCGLAVKTSHLKL
ncbi:unnamed protein product [Rotaria magnacalcarata]|uniref:Uncharacterized protein n=1 Tax=Rotaria magnacalcarata TaxID=392030 RepID=A0A816NGV8_9BILA|nr:unnamed protein product [Rotaria magnacalcarata]CAF3764351.1 unnamed protein product [Rotaria magnacalcarata]CAF4182772.1 unnamed protein product [Rotaria magnacalcarata]